jgi:hypothetical protein
VSLLGWRLASGEQEHKEPGEGAKPEQRVVVVDGATVLKIDVPDQRRSGISTSPVAAASAPEMTEAYAAVVDAGPLLDLSTAEVSARTQLDAARAKLAASRAAHERAKLLFHDDENVSLAQLQAAEAAHHADQAALSAAEAQRKGAEANARLQFGPVLGARLGGPLVQQLVQRQSVLLQVATPPGAPTAAPPQVLTLRTAQGVTAQARFISPAVRTDPRVQGVSYYYVAPAAPGLLTGTNLAAQLPTGRLLSGALVPASATVVWQGQTWVYRRTGSETFRREPIATAAPTRGGYIVGSLRPGAQVVTAGAQLLLSEETRPAGGGEGDED